MFVSRSGVPARILATALVPSVDRSRFQHVMAQAFALLAPVVVEGTSTPVQFQQFAVEAGYCSAQALSSGDA